MHVHLPKPAHGWREFFGEVGIIVVGVLIALAAEQLVEAVHERGLRNEAHETISAEIERNMDVFRRRIVIQPCIDKRLSDIETIVTKTPFGTPLPRPLWIGRPQIWDISDSRMQSATSGARTALLSSDAQAQYGEIYAGFKTLDATQYMEQVAWAHLRALETLPSLDAASQFTLITALHEARYANFRIKVASLQAYNNTKKLGISGKRLPYEEGSRSICLPLNSSRDWALHHTMTDRIGIEP